MNQESLVSRISLQDDDPLALESLLKLFYGIKVFSSFDELLAKHAHSHSYCVENLPSFSGFSSASTSDNNDRSLTPESAGSFSSQKSPCSSTKTNCSSENKIPDMLSDVTSVYIVAEKYDSPYVRAELLQLFTALSGGDQKKYGCGGAYGDASSWVWSDANFLKSGRLAVLMKKIFDNLPETDALRARAVAMTKLALPSYYRLVAGEQPERQEAKTRSGCHHAREQKEALESLLDSVPELAREITLLVASEGDSAVTPGRTAPPLSLSHKFLHHHHRPLNAPAASTTTTSTPSPPSSSYFDSLLLPLQPPHKTALHWAAQHGDIHKLERLLSLGVPVDIVDENGERPLHFAVWYGQLDATRFLVENGADVGSPSLAFPHGTPLRWAVTRGHVEIEDVLRNARARKGGR